MVCGMKTILLTGSSRGIGAATRKALEARGAKVIGHATTLANQQTVAADFTKVDAPDHLWAAALDRAEGQVDVLVSNAGLFRPNPIDAPDTDWLEAWEETLRINLTASARLCRLAIRHWQERGIAGRIVHVASRAGHRGDSPSHWHYAASKGGMLALHKTIARAYAPEYITSFALAPGFTDTAMAGDYLESRGGPALLADIPLGRVAEPEEIASIITYCALDAPGSMTGATLDVNGASYVR